MSRTSLKQQLMKEQLEKQEQKREAQSRQRFQTQHYVLQANSHQSHPLSQQFMHKVQINGRSSLENPTIYHVLQTQGEQDQKLVAPVVTSPTASAKTGVSLSNGPQSPFPLSPDSPLSAPPSSAASTSEYEDVWDDLKGILGTENMQQIIEDSVLASTVPGDMNFLLEQQQSSSDVPSKISSSCPPVAADMKAWVKERQKKDNHNQIERRRRYNINDRIKELATLLPPSDDPKYGYLVRDMKQNKGTTLKASCDYVRELKHDLSQQSRVEEENRRLKNDQRRMAIELQESKRKMQELEVMLRQHGLLNNSNSHSIHSIASTWTPVNTATAAAANSNAQLMAHSVTDSLLTGSCPPKLASEESIFANKPLTSFVKQESYTLSPSQSSSGLGSSLPTTSPSFMHMNEVMMESRHDPLLTTINIKDEAFSPQSMDICQ